MFPLYFLSFLTNHSLFLYSSSLALPSLLSSQVILSSVAMFALPNRPSRNVVRLGLLCLYLIMGEESREFSNAVLGWKQQGPWHSKLGSTFESCSLKLSHPFGPMECGEDCMRWMHYSWHLWPVNLLGRVGGNEPCCGNREKSACLLTHQ